MKLMRKFGAVLSVLIAALALTAVSPMPHAGAVDEDGTGCEPSQGMWFVILYDISGSLRQTDPQATRRTGGLAAIRDLVRLQQEYPTFNFYVSVDSFATDYSSGGWVDLLTDSETEVDRLLTRTSQVGSSNRGISTDYTAALSGALDRFALTPDTACRSLIWFTDGAHDTVRGSADRLTHTESAQVDSLCLPTGAAGLLTEANVSATAVYLSSGRDVALSEPLRRLFGESHVECPAPLTGEIVDVPDVTGLARTLREYIEDEGFESVEQIPPTEACVPTQDTRVRTCEFVFALDSGEAAFDLYVDLKNVTTPQMPAAAIVAPDGTRTGMSFPSQREMHRASGFWFRRRHPIGEKFWTSSGGIL